MFFPRRIIASFVGKEVIYFSTVIFFTLSFLVSINQFYLILKDSIFVPYLVSEIVKIITLKIIINSPIIITVSFFAGISMAISKLYRQSEMFILIGAGIGKANFFKLIFLPVIIYFFISSFLVFFLNPSLNKEINDMKLQIQNDIERIKFQSSKFHSYDRGKLNIYIENIRQNNQGYQSYLGVFVVLKDKNDTVIVTSKTGSKKRINGDIFLELNEGKKYRLNSGNSYISDIQEFSNIKINLNKSLGNDKESFIKKDNELKTIDLLNDLSIYGSELFWRMAMPLSLMVLSIIAIYVTKPSLRQIKKANYLYLFLFMLVYFNLLIIVRNEITTSASFFIGSALTFYIPLLISFLVIWYNLHTQLKIKKSQAAL